MQENVSIKLPNIPELNEHVLLQREKEAIGMYFSGHPLNSYRSALDKMQYSVMDLQEADGISGIMDNTQVVVGGMLTACKQKPTKNGNGVMGYANLEGITGSVECVLFTRTLQTYGACFYEDAEVEVTGRLNIREDRSNSLLIEKLRLLKDVECRSLFIRLPSLLDEHTETALRYMKAHKGNVPVTLVDGAKRIARQAPKDLWVDLTDEALREAQQLFGKENVIVK